MKQTAIIMAGGKGERFWPQSRTATPKQFLSLTGDGKTMLQLTVERLQPLVAIEDVFIVTNKSYRALVQQQLPQLPADNILCEPEAKNTAPCIAFAAGVVAARYENAVMYVLASDHIIKNTSLFRSTLKLAARVAGAGENLVTLGITPAYPETGYGYINFHNEAAEGYDTVFPVERFVEKPDRATARRYLEEGTYLWNSGMFVWTSATYLANLEQYLPEVYNAAQLICEADKRAGGKLQYDETLCEAFTMCPNVSVDYGVMEKAANIYTIPGSFGWDDVGSWLSLGRINKLDEHGNYTSGNVVALECENSIMVSNGRLLSAAGVENLVIVETPDAVMVCDKGEAQKVKDIVQALRERGQTHLL